mgnify:CR=1 FL=1
MGNNDIILWPEYVFTYKSKSVTVCDSVWRFWPFSDSEDRVIQDDEKVMGTLRIALLFPDRRYIEPPTGCIIYNGFNDILYPPE